MKRSSSKKMIVSVLVSVCMTLLTIGCGCTARAKKMTPEYLDMVFDGAEKPYSVSVNEATVPMQRHSLRHKSPVDKELDHRWDNESTLGYEPNPRWGAGIPMTEFTWALTDALEQSRVFQTVKKINDGADYVLDVAILDYDQPWYGSSMTVRLETKWQLTEVETQKVVWSNTFPISKKVVWIESLGSITDRGRAQKAQEDAARAAIKEGIRRLSIVEL